MGKLADCIEAVLLENGETTIWAGKFGLCGKVVHPLNRTRSVIAAARNSPKFQQTGYIRACDSKGTREILHPVFKPKENEQCTK